MLKNNTFVIFIYNIKLCIYYNSINDIGNSRQGRTKGVTTMEKWTKPELETLDINETAHKWTGVYRDGGYIGDGQISGHLSWNKPTDDSNSNGDGITDMLS